MRTQTHWYIETAYLNIIIYTRKCVEKSRQEWILSGETLEVIDIAYIYCIFDKHILR